MMKLSFGREAIYNGDLVLVNRAHPIHLAVPESELVPVAGGHDGILLHARAQAALAGLLRALDDADNAIVPVSGYRSLAEQARIFEDSMRENGPDFTRQFVAPPNASEHQTGLAVDLGEDRSAIDTLRGILCPRFSLAASPSFQRRAAAYGFVQRYAAGKEAVTGIACEPWHYRYVGRPHAAIMQCAGLTLEEYIEYLKRFVEPGQHLLVYSPRSVIEIYYVPFPDGAPELTLALPDDAHHEVSGNNVDGLVVTLLRHV